MNIDKADRFAEAFDDIAWYGALKNVSGQKKDCEAWNGRSDGK